MLVCEKRRGSPAQNSDPGERSIMGSTGKGEKGQEEEDILWGASSVLVATYF